MQDFLTHSSYAGLVLILLATGIGLPVPEDVPLLAAGFLCNEGVMRLEFAVPLALTAVIGSDAILFYLGRRFEKNVKAGWLTRRLVTPDRLERASRIYENHGGKALFAARFLPGFRAAMFFAAGATRIPFWKLLVFDGGAAVLSVPTLILLGYWFADSIEVIRDQERKMQVAIAALILVSVVAVAFIAYVRRRTGAPAGTPSQPNG